jgi:hypothetical protein
MRKTFEPKSDNVIGERIRLHTKELNDWYSSPDIQMIK